MSSIVGSYSGSVGGDIEGPVSKGSTDGRDPVEAGVFDSEYGARATGGSSVRDPATPTAVVPVGLVGKLGADAAPAAIGLMELAGKLREDVAFHRHSDR